MATTRRMDWVDLVKATSVILVVLMHVVQTMPMAMGDTAAATFWMQVGGMLEPLRMPVFFVVSGMLAASAVNRPWTDTRQRTLGIGYLYVLWSLILVATLTVTSTDPAANLTAIPQTLLFAPNGYWYLMALVVYFVVARLLRNQPVLVVLAVAAIPNLLRPVNGDLVLGAVSPLTENTMWPALTANLVFFLAGAYHRKIFARIAERADWRIVGGLTAALLVAGAARALTPALWSHTFLPLSVGWIVAAIMTAALLTRNEGPARDFGRYVGARTLPIFVLQFPLLHLIRLHWESGGYVITATAAQFLYPVLVTVALVVFALALFALTAGRSGRHLFVVPDWALGKTRPFASWTITPPGLTDRRTTVPLPVAA